LTHPRIGSYAQLDFDFLLLKILTDLGSPLGLLKKQLNSFLGFKSSIG